MVSSEPPYKNDQCLTTAYRAKQPHIGSRAEKRAIKTWSNIKCFPFKKVQVWFGANFDNTNFFAKLPLRMRVNGTPNNIVVKEVFRKYSQWSSLNL